MSPGTLIVRIFQSCTGGWCAWLPYNRLRAEMDEVINRDLTWSGELKRRGSWHAG